MQRPSAVALVLTACLLPGAPAEADWTRLLDSITGGGDGSTQSSAGTLTDEEVIRGLKEALDQGARRAVESLGRTDGFFGNPDVRIPMPEKLETVESALRALKQDRYADEFLLTMNRAAESAVPEARAILGEAIRQMTVDDARRILGGPDDAATQYFRKVGGERLARRMRPIIEDATSRTGVTRAYKSLVDRAGVAARLAGADTVDIDAYVTEEALDGLFLLIAREEKRIRENPVARTSEILKKVFTGG
ncbi:MAG: DUF4197 domain-containing protein [Gammaproteobacteria bacterium]|nr:DUF4197 domain-containing protein [Gammaproteobacteria bacterium]